MAETILQHPILTNFVYPFLLVFFIVFAILEKTKLLGEDRKQLNALLSFVIGLIFVSVAYPKFLVTNLILFLSVAIVIVFVVLILWGFVFAKERGGFEMTSSMKYALGSILILGVIVAIFLITGIGGKVIDFLFKSSWSETFWVNFIFILLIAIALGAILKGGKS